MATKTSKKTSKTRASASTQRATEQRMAASIIKAARDAGIPAATVAAQQSANIAYYLLIDFGFTAGQPFQPNSVQFYSTTGFLCSKVVDNASLVSLAPILACPTIRVTWNTATLEAVHIYGKKP